ncbi:MAG: hypothetical protein ACOCYZ_01405 [Halococcoides sp.]
MHRRAFPAWLEPERSRRPVVSTGFPRTPAPHPGRRPDEVLGVAHLDGRYHLTDDPFLIEGAKTVAEVGSNVLRLWLDFPAWYYPYNHDWQAEYDSMADVASESAFRAVFEMDFSTYLLTATANHRWPRNYFCDGVTGREANQESERFEDLTRHLMTICDGTGKTFVLQDSEADYAAVPDGDASQTLTDRAVRGLTRYYEARQAGVEAGRRAVG